MAGLDNFCWCDPVQSEKTPDGDYKLGQLVRANQALFDITTVYRIPCISGKDSMKNDYNIGDTKISIPPTVLFTAVGIVPDVNQAMSPDFKRAGDVIYLVGVTRDETGGSEYFASRGFVGNKVPRLTEPELTVRTYRAVHQAMTAGLVASCHDLSDGGLGIALAESAFSGGLGATVSLADMLCDGVERDDVAVFSETPCRLLISVRPELQRQFEECMKGFPIARVGRVISESRLRVKGLLDHNVVDADIWELKRKWQRPLGI
jgi:phosphoribosylformylglycinamidine synthase